MLQSIAHTPEGRIDADACLFGDLLEALLFPVAKAHDLLLLGRELAQAVAQLIDIFAVDQALLSDSVGRGDLRSKSPRSSALDHACADGGSGP